MFYGFEARGRYLINRGHWHPLLVLAALVKARHDLADPASPIDLFEASDYVIDDDGLALGWIGETYAPIVVNRDPLWPGAFRLEVAALDGLDPDELCARAEEIIFSFCATVATPIGTATIRLAS